MKITSPCPHMGTTYVWAKESELKFKLHDKVRVPLFDQGTIESAVVYVDREDSNYYILEIGEFCYEQILHDMLFNPLDGTLIADSSPKIYRFIPHFIKDTVQAFELSLDEWIEKIISKLENKDPKTEIKYRFVSSFELRIFNPYFDKEIDILVIDKFLLEFENCQCSFDTDDESIGEIVKFINKILANDIYAVSLYEDNKLKKGVFAEGDINWSLSAKQLREAITGRHEDCEFNYSIYCSAWGKYRSKWFDNPDGDKGFAYVLEEDTNVLFIVKGDVPVNYGSGQIKKYSKRKAIINYIYFNSYCQNQEDMYSKALVYLEKMAKECGYKRILSHHQKCDSGEIVDDIDFYKKHGYRKVKKLNRKKLDNVFNHNMKIYKDDRLYKKKIK